VGTVKALFDTNIIIDALQALPHALCELERYEECMISRISWIEILEGARTKRAEEAFRDYLKKFTICELTDRASERVITLRSSYKLKISDAIIWATAEEQGCLLVTRNSKDFPANHPAIRFPYRI
jgi:hypothetical protein